MNEGSRPIVVGGLMELARIACNGCAEHHPIDLIARTGTLASDWGGQYDARLVNNCLSLVVGDDVKYELGLSGRWSGRV